MEIKFKIADHACLLDKEPDAIEIRHFENLKIWKLEDANWVSIEQYVSAFAWSCLGEGTVDNILDNIMSVFRFPDTRLHLTEHEDDAQI